MTPSFQCQICQKFINNCQHFISIGYRMLVSEILLLFCIGRIGVKKVCLAMSEPKRVKKGTPPSLNLRYFGAFSGFWCTLACFDNYLGTLLPFENQHFCPSPSNNSNGVKIMSGFWRPATKLRRLGLPNRIVDNFRF